MGKMSELDIKLAEGAHLSDDERELIKETVPLALQREVYNDLDTRKKKYRGIVKDVTFMRARGIWLEQIDLFLEYNGAREEGIRWFFYPIPMGSSAIPSLYIGCRDSHQWVQVRDLLRSKGLLR